MSGRSPLEDRLHPSRRLFADQDRARFGLGLEPRRDVHGISHRPVLDARTSPDRPDDDRPRLHADADAEPVDPPAPTDLVGELPHLLHDPQSSEEGALGVVLVRDGRAEEREHTVARQVLDRAAERLDRSHDAADGVADHELQLLRVEALPESVDPTRSANRAVTNRRSSRIVVPGSLTGCIVPTAHGDGATDGPWKSVSRTRSNVGMTVWAT